MPSTAEENVKLACPVPSSVTFAASVVVPSLKVTVPTVTAACVLASVTAAVIVTFVFCNVGFCDEDSVAGARGVPSHPASVR